MASTPTASSSTLSTIPEIGLVCLCGNFCVLVYFLHSTYLGSNSPVLLLTILPIAIIFLATSGLIFPVAAIPFFKNLARAAGGKSVKAVARRILQLANDDDRYVDWREILADKPVGEQDEDDLPDETIIGNNELGLGLDWK